jgi:hypothetical protein
MAIWTRDDGRFYRAELTRDLFGYVVLIAHGGKFRPPRVRSIPVSSTEEGERVLARIELRRLQHGYRCDPVES